MHNAIMCTVYILFFQVFFESFVWHIYFLCRNREVWKTNDLKFRFATNKSFFENAKENRIGNSPKITRNYLLYVLFSFKDK